MSKDLRPKSEGHPQAGLGGTTTVCGGVFRSLLCDLVALLASIVTLRLLEPLPVKFSSRAFVYCTAHTFVAA
eukprot:2705843-Rhodomonas_salina.1